MKFIQFECKYISYIYNMTQFYWNISYNMFKFMFTPFQN
jgi:hypothetical protein